MARFIRKVLLFVLMVGGAFTSLLLLNSKGDGDYFYRRFTTPRYSSLIIGTSRAAQGIEPSILNDILQVEDSMKIYNYSFTIAHSPYGGAYLTSIKRKLTPGTANGIFLVTVDPWALSEGDSRPCCAEEEMIPYTIHFPYLNPSLEYIFEAYENAPIRFLYETINPHKYHINEGGRLVIDFSRDTTVIYRNIKKKIEAYNQYHDWELSSYRLSKLEELVAYLKDKGKVYMIRMPVSEHMVQLEQQQFPAFPTEMEKLSKMLQVPYRDFTDLSEDLITTDGNHLNNDYVPTFTAIVAEWIKQVNAVN